MNGRIEILIIDHEKQTIETLSSLFKQQGFNVFGVYTGHKGLELTLNNNFGIILLDLTLPDIDSLELIKKIKGGRVSAPLLVMGTNDKIQQAVKAIKLGASGFIDKFYHPDMIMHIVQNALNYNELENKLTRLSQSLSDQYNFIGHSDVVEQLRDKVKRLANSSSRIHFIGESGSGKLMAARYVHYCSNRATGPFNVVNCAAVNQEKVDSNLWLESDLFGHQKGAFKAAQENRKGKFELADGGSLYLNEVGALRADLQAKLLRAIESGSIQRMGSTEEIRVDVRIMSSSTINLESEVKSGRFREDLYFRLNVIPVIVLPLRSHTDDIPLLVRHFLDEAGFINLQVDEEGMNFLKSYHWPGNVKELKNTIEKTLTIFHGDIIKFAHLNSALAAIQSQPAKGIPFSVMVSSEDDKSAALLRPDMTLRQQIADFERRLLKEVFNSFDGNITKAAEILKIDRGNLSKKLKKLGITSKNV